MIAIEVGANNGRDTQAMLDQGYEVYAFEPTPELHLDLSKRLSHYENYYPICAAVDTEDGWGTFYVAGQSDWGCSSLHDFNPEIHSLWEGRPDFNVTHKYTVQKIRLDTFMEVYSFNKIDYLWIDAQGNDLAVLQSLGSRIYKVRAGRCEVALTVNLYNTDNTFDNVTKFLEDNGFTYTWDTENGKEANIYFSR
jgi:FkbM family methyltransferase